MGRMLAWRGTCRGGTLISEIMIDATETNPFADLGAMLSASRQNYDACVDHVEYDHTITGVRAKMRLHHLRFDANGHPKLDALAKCLVDHAIDYAISSRNRPAMLTAQEAARYMQEARRLFRVVAAPTGTADLAGEAGEMLLYLLLEAVIEAPQVVAKIELKTNPALEVNGSDGIHMRWHPTDNLVDVYFGESKMYTDVGAALTSAFNSIEDFHANGMRAHEYAMVTKFFKGIDDEVKAAVADVLDTGLPGPDARINHACLIGYDWAATGLTPGQAATAVQAEYKRQFIAEAPSLHQRLQRRFNSCRRRQYGFEVFFLPFTSVQAFRNAFDAAME